MFKQFYFCVNNGNGLEARSILYDHTKHNRYLDYGTEALHPYSIAPKKCGNHPEILKSMA